MKAFGLLNRIPKKLIIALVVVCLVYLALTLFVFKKDPLLSFGIFLFNKYILSLEYVANLVFRITETNVVVENHTIVIKGNTEYAMLNQHLLNNWTSYILYKKWSVFIIILIWGNIGRIANKLKYTILFFGVHYLAVISSFIIIGIIGPIYISPDSLTELRPNVIGSVLMFIYFTFWLYLNKNNLKRRLGSLNIKIRVSEKKIKEILFIFFGYTLLRNFIVPYFNFYSYIDFLLSITKSIVGNSGFYSHIDGPYLHGERGTLFMAKWCLGFVTMYIYSSVIFLTRKDIKTTSVFIVSGIIFLHVLNIIRLSMLFVFIQKNDNIELAYDHHNLYNVIVYIILFVIWIIYFEKFSNLKLHKRRLKSV